MYNNQCQLKATVSPISKIIWTSICPSKKNIWNKPWELKKIKLLVISKQEPVLSKNWEFPFHSIFLSQKQEDISKYWGLFTKWKDSYWCFWNCSKHSLSGFWTELKMLCFILVNHKTEVVSDLSVLHENSQFTCFMPWGFFPGHWDS